MERFLIPIEFAPAIPYKGIEDIRFTPGWGKAETEEYWSYAFLWYLEGKQDMSAKTIIGNLQAYYTGLVGRNIAPRKIPAEKNFPVKAYIKQIAAAQGDIKTFIGTVSMLDYMAQKPILLRCRVHIKSCPLTNNSFIFTEISPKAYGDDVWKSLDELWTTFNCNKAVQKK